MRYDKFIENPSIDIEEHLEKARKPVKEETTAEKLASGYCAAGEHETKEEIMLCKHCKRTFCLEHGDEERRYCNECIEKFEIKLR
jgi:hypothetical protein